MILRMEEEISYLLITPYTLVKSRTGGVISRLLSRLDLDLIGARIFTFSDKTAEKYAKTFLTQPTSDERGVQGCRLLHDYVLSRFSPTKGRGHRTMLLLFKGKDVCRKISLVSGALYQEHFSKESFTGETIRDTYADLIHSRSDKNAVEYFEPAVISPRNIIDSRRDMAILAEEMDKQPNIVENSDYDPGIEIERTLVILKPDNWRRPSARPGTVIDMFSRTGLRMIGCKIYRMSVDDAMEFYGPVRNTLIEKLSPVFAAKSRKLLQDKFGFPLDKDIETELIASIGKRCAINQFNRIVEFMTGRHPEECSEDMTHVSGTVKTMALVYEGVNAITKIRDVLGPTDPTQAPAGTIRSDFGKDVMVNTAHASDSIENAQREVKIIKMDHNSCSELMIG